MSARPPCSPPPCLSGHSLGVRHVAAVFPHVAVVLAHVDVMCVRVAGVAVLLERGSVGKVRHLRRVAHLGALGLSAVSGRLLAFGHGGGGSRERVRVRMPAMWRA